MSKHSFNIARGARKQQPEGDASLGLTCLLYTSVLVLVHLAEKRAVAQLAVGERVDLGRRMRIGAQFSQHDAKTVSYTHLDVYKRQLKRFAACCAAAVCCAAMLLLATGCQQQQESYTPPEATPSVSKPVIAQEGVCLLYTSRCV